jgi:Cu(I)/Ag(I) efflux system protein CusF
MKFAIALLAGLALASPAAAQGHGAHSPAAAAAPAAAGAVQGVGVVRAVDAKKGVVTIDHAPIKALNWGSMTMAFKADPALLKGVTPGAKVAFQLRDQKIIDIRKQ